MTTKADTPVSAHRNQRNHHRNHHRNDRRNHRDDHRPARWVRTRLGANPLAALLMAALAFVTIFLAAAFPRLADRGADAALRDFVSQRGLTATSLQTTSRLRPEDAGPVLDTVQKVLLERVGAKLPLAVAGQAHGARSTGYGPMNNPNYTRVGDRNPPGLSLVYLQGLADRVTLVEGAWPGAADPGAPLPIVVSRQAAEAIGIKLGDHVDNGADVTGKPLVSVVTGFYRVNDPRDPYWEDIGCPDRACFQAGNNGNDFLKTTGFLDGGSLRTLATWGWTVDDFWRLPVDVAALRADQLDRTRSTLNSFVSGPDAALLGRVTGRADLHTSALLSSILTSADTRLQAARPLSGIGPAGVAGVAAVVLFLAAALTTDRRIAEIRLLRARGGSLLGVLRRLLGEGLVTVLPAAVLATALALVLLPTPRWGDAVLAALAATLLALLAFPARAALLWSRERAGGGRRRLVGELVVLAVTVAAVVEVRRRGVGQAGAAPDPLLVAAPLLLAVTGGLLLARIEPLVVGRLAALAGRGRGLVAFLGLARAARDSSGRRSPSVLPLLALLIAVTTTGFGATVLDTVEQSRTRAAQVMAGGDVSVTIPAYGKLSEEFTKAAGELPGTRAATAAWVEPKATFIGGDQDYTRASLVVVEPKAYAEIARTLGIGEFDPAKLAGTPGGPDTPLPALFSSDLVKRLSTGAAKVRTPNGNELRTSVAGIVDATPALPDPGLPFVVVAAGPAAERLPEKVQVNSWFAVGDLDPEQVRTTLREKGLTQPTGLAKRLADEAAAGGRGTHGLPAGYNVRSSRETSAALADDPLQHAAGRLFWYAAAAGAGFAVLAVLLTLFRAAPERTAVLARLRTMGLRPRQGLALIVAEAMPQALAAAVGGGLVATAAVGLLGSAFDISTLVGARVGDVLAPALLPVLLPTAGLALLVGLVVVLETLIAGRRQIATELRAGERQ
ncbi:putative ABC transport system permease protein [Streptomyces sp. 1114.5]|uniref:hypothetical protein n=1 Tax=Streptomyces sp. 1114.5 TaxID=1938830 RepID=UPI000EB0409D|nr:hypothetical protein [Streptomyces sp. 1114.5]RKT19774.1 putative ABC transport system permease protein [Streptomyces sp. 1114.5]